MSSAVDARPRVIRPGVLALLALAVGSLLALLFPGLDFGHPKYLGPPDELSIAYLEQVLRTHPGDRPARLLLARQQRALGHWEAAEGSLRLLAGGGDRIATQAEMELVELSRARLDALMPADPERPLRQQQSLAALRLVDPILLNVDQLSHLAETALALEAPGDAAEIYERLSALDIANRHDWLLRAARWRLATGALTASVDLYLAASRVAPAEWAAREDVLRALEVLTSANRGKESLQAADTALGRWPTDRRLLDRGITLARAQGDGARAKRWSERLVALGPEDDAILRRHLDIELGEGDVATAFTVATRLVGAPPRGRGAAAQARRDGDLVGARRGGAGRLGLARQPRLRRGREAHARARSRSLRLRPRLRGAGATRGRRQDHARRAARSQRRARVARRARPRGRGAAPARAGVRRDARLLDRARRGRRAPARSRRRARGGRTDPDAFRPARRGRGARGRAAVGHGARRRRAGGGAARGADDDRRRDQLLAALRRSGLEPRGRRRRGLVVPAALDARSARRHRRRSPGDVAGRQGARRRGDPHRRRGVHALRLAGAAGRGAGCRRRRRSLGRRAPPGRAGARGRQGRPVRLPGRLLVGRGAAHVARREVARGRRCVQQGGGALARGPGRARGPALGARRRRAREGAARQRRRRHEPTTTPARGSRRRWSGTIARRCARS